MKEGDQDTLVGRSLSSEDETFVGKESTADILSRLCPAERQRVLRQADLYYDALVSARATQGPHGQEGKVGKDKSESDSVNVRI